MAWIGGWPLLCISLFVHEPYREQLLAGQTLLCSLFRKQHNFHVATMVFVIFYFTHRPVHGENVYAEILKHVVVACAVGSQYIDERYSVPIWTLAAWSTRWLSTTSIFDTPARSVVKCIIYAAVTRGPWHKRADFKWCWVLFTHEIAWVLLPVQILFEVYNNKKKINTLDIV